MDEPVDNTPNTTAPMSSECRAGRCGNCWVDEGKCAFTCHDWNTEG